MDIEIDGQNGELESRLHHLCRDLLSNPVIEDYELLKHDSRNDPVRKAKNQKKTKSL
jgi:phosphoribosylformylglycinamidine (FGAM) synthase PurS component